VAAGTFCRAAFSNAVTDEAAGASVKAGRSFSRGACATESDSFLARATTRPLRVCACRFSVTCSSDPARSRSGGSTAGGAGAGFADGATASAAPRAVSGAGVSAALRAASGGAPKCGISSFVRIASITANVDSMTAAAAAKGQRGRVRGFAAASTGLAPTSRAAAANIDARADAAGRSSSSALACR